MSGFTTLKGCLSSIDSNRAATVRERYVARCCPLPYGRGSENGLFEHALRQGRFLLLGLVLTCGCGPGDGSVSLISGPSLFGGRGQPWTIQCYELSGTYAKQQIDQLAEVLRATDGIKPSEVFVRQDPDASRLYYGKYRRRTDREGRMSVPKQMREDLTFLRELVAGPAQRVFLFSVPVPMPTERAGKPEWALENVNAVWTLQVAAFQPTDTFHDQRLAAAKYCEELRNKGFEAFYYHASATSMVTVGAFGAEAVKFDGRGGATYHPSVVALQQREECKYNLTNGRIIKVRSLPVRSQLVRVPGKDSAG